MIEKDIARFWEKVAVGEVDECWIWLAHCTNGYGRFRYNGRALLAHRVSWELEYEEIPEGIFVLHKCIATPSCVNPKHLYLGVHQDNAWDAMEQGRVSTTPKYGEEHRGAKLTNDQVREIRSKLPFTSGIELSKEYGVSCQCISSIKTGVAWKTIK